MNLKKALLLRKAKYLRRWRGKTGKWQYEYSTIKGGEKPTKEQKRKAKKFKKPLTQKHDEIKEIRNELKQSPKNVSSNTLGKVANLMKKDKATDSYHWLRGFMGSNPEEAKAMYSEMKKRGLIKETTLEIK